MQAVRQAHTLYMVRATILHQGPGQHCLTMHWLSVKQWFWFITNWIKICQTYTLFFGQFQCDDDDGDDDNDDDDVDDFIHGQTLLPRPPIVVIPWPILRAVASATILRPAFAVVPIRRVRDRPVPVRPCPVRPVLVKPRPAIPVPVVIPVPVRLMHHRHWWSSVIPWARSSVIPWARSSVIPPNIIARRTGPRCVIPRRWPTPVSLARRGRATVLVRPTRRAVRHVSVIHRVILQETHLLLHNLHDHTRRILPPGAPVKIQNFTWVWFNTIHSKFKSFLVYHETSCWKIG